jgi:Arc/MetJ-type ribon-helix-helix transcriptional regulator
MPTSYSLPRLIEDEIDALIDAGYYSSKSDVVKDALRTLLEIKANLRIAASVEMYKKGRVSIGKASEVAGMSVIEFKEVLIDRGIKRRIRIEKKEMVKSDRLIKKVI